MLYELFEVWFCHSVNISNHRDIDTVEDFYETEYIQIVIPAAF